MERRRPPNRAAEKPTPLPPDYLKLVESVFTTNFANELERLAGTGPRPVFKAGGGLFPTELVLWVALLQAGRMPATTVHSSADFLIGDDSPEDAESRLAACVDAIGIVFSEILTPDALTQLRIGSQATLAEMPVGWSETAIRNRAIYLMVDSSNPDLDKMTDEWLEKNDTSAAAADLEEDESGEEETPSEEEPDEEPTKPLSPVKRKNPPATKH